MRAESASSWGASSASATSDSDDVVPPVPSESDHVVLLEESLLELSSAILAFFCLTGGSTWRGGNWIPWQLQPTHMSAKGSTPFRCACSWSVVKAIASSLTTLIDAISVAAVFRKSTARFLEAISGMPRQTSSCTQEAETHLHRMPAKLRLQMPLLFQQSMVSPNRLFSLLAFVTLPSPSAGRTGSSPARSVA